MRRPALRHHAFALVTLSLALTVAGQGIARAGEAPAAADPHAAHRHMMEAAASSSVKRTVTNYAVPHLSLVRADGARVALDEELNDGRPVVLNFIFTTCTTICPTMSTAFSKVPEKMGAGAGKLRMISVSVDPEFDKPAQLKAYAKQFGAGANWQFLTGSVEDVGTVLRAFDNYHADKMDYGPLTFLRPAPGKPWVRIDGFASAEELVREYRNVVSN